jgi:hypothetical protein
MAAIGRPPVLDAEKKEKILEALGQGFSVRFAARRVGCDEGTIRNAAKRDPEFAAEMDQRQYDAEFDMVKNIRQASATPQYWRAAAWNLERSHPDRYAPRGRHTITPEQVVHLGKQFIAAIERNVPEEIRAPLIQDIRRLLGETLTEGATRILEDRADYLPEDCLPPYSGDDSAAPAPRPEAPACAPPPAETGDGPVEDAIQGPEARTEEGLAPPPGEAGPGAPAFAEQSADQEERAAPEAADRKRQGVAPPFAENSAGPPAGLQEVPAGPAHAREAARPEQDGGRGPREGGRKRGAPFQESPAPPPIAEELRGAPHSADREGPPAFCGKIPQDAKTPGGRNAAP